MNEKSHKKFQTMENFFPFLIMISKETADVYKNKHIVEFFKFFEELKNNGLDGSEKLNISSPQDMASFQKTLGKGGGSGTKKFFCHCCSITKEQRANPRINKCQDCEDKSIPCYHYEVEDKKKVEDYKEENKRLLVLHP